MAAEIDGHAAEIEHYLDDLAKADAATDPDELEAEKARIRAAVAERQGKVERQRGALDGHIRPKAGSSKARSAPETATSAAILDQRVAISRFLAVSN